MHNSRRKYCQKKKTLNAPYWITTTLPPPPYLFNLPNTGLRFNQTELKLLANSYSLLARTEFIHVFLLSIFRTRRTTLATTLIFKFEIFFIVRRRKRRRPLAPRYNTTVTVRAANKARVMRVQLQTLVNRLRERQVFHQKRIRIGEERIFKKITCLAKIIAVDTTFRFLAFRIHPQNIFSHIRPIIQVYRKCFRYQFSTIFSFFGTYFEFFYNPSFLNARNRISH